jgi:hypothetical protein
VCARNKQLSLFFTATTCLPILCCHMLFQLSYVQQKIVSIMNNSLFLLQPCVCLLYAEMFFFSCSTFLQCPPHIPNNIHLLFLEQPRVCLLFAATIGTYLTSGPQ